MQKKPPTKQLAWLSVPHCPDVCTAHVRGPAAVVVTCTFRSLLQYFWGTFPTSPLAASSALVVHGVKFTILVS